MSGIFGAVSTKGKNIAETVFYGTDYHSHLGTEFGGMATIGKYITRKICNISQSQFKSKFFEEHMAMAGDMGIGVISAREDQPICLNSKFVPLCICTNGLVSNLRELSQELYKGGVSFSEVTEAGINTTELVAKLISRGRNITEGIAFMFDKIRGSCSLLLLTSKGIYAARDRFGYSPLIIGEKENGFAVTTETSAFYNLGFKVRKYLCPGEIALLGPSGIDVQKKGRAVRQINSFLWIYTGFPASTYEKINVEIVRERCGMFLAKRDNVRADMAAGLPDSGTTHAIGYALESKIPFRRPLVKYTPGYGRSYTPPTQKVRDLVARMKLIPIKEVIKGKRIVLCDDSIVRGTQLKNYTLQKLWDNGAKEIHLRIACPPLMFPNKFDYSTRRLNELAARRAIQAIEGKMVKNIDGYLDHTSKKYKKMVDYITRELGATSLRYQTIDDMVKAIGLPKEELCLYVWTGKTEAAV